MFKATQALERNFITQPPQQLWEYLLDSSAIDETLWLKELLSIAEATEISEPTKNFAIKLVTKVRSHKKTMGMLDALLLEYSLDTREGILLMSLSEALIRIPDPLTAQALIDDKLALGNWRNHRHKSNSIIVNTATWSLLLTQRLLNLSPEQSDSAIKKMFARFSAPIIRQMIRQSMKIIGHQFVLGTTMANALEQGKRYRKKGYTYTFDMLGEAALTQQDADGYANDYFQSIAAVGKVPELTHSPKPSISIKLSALHPRYDSLKEQRVFKELVTTVTQLVQAARKQNIAITIDAEEMDRLEISLQIFEHVYRSEICRGWGKFGLVVQAYSKRALAILSWLASLAHEVGDEIPTRLVKGAYWDTEIKLYQQRGLNNYPVYTRKEATDVSYFVCAQMLLCESTQGLLFPQFASHNAQSIAAIMQLPAAHPFEFQRLHGMGDVLYDQILKDHHIPVRIYAPVGKHSDLLPYLVRRLLENGANNSFVHRIVDPRCSIDDIVEDPILKLRNQSVLPNPRIVLPTNIYGPNRKNSTGINLHSGQSISNFLKQRDKYQQRKWQSGPIIAGALKFNGSLATSVVTPYDHTHVIGYVSPTLPEHFELALAQAQRGQQSWSQRPVVERALCLKKTALLFEEHRTELIALCQYEAGKTIQDAIDEIREAVDFCYYYAQQAELNLVKAKIVKNDLGQNVAIRYQGQGLFACISPWNFPLAIFTGQIMAALVSGNTVIAKPAPQTSLIAAKAISLMHQAGIPMQALHLITGGAELGQKLMADPRISGVAFTGSIQTARTINQTLANREQLPVPLIAETGGQNAMIVDSSALTEQVIKDVLRSAFASAGQRCSALRILCLQEDIADTVIHRLAGAMTELTIGDPTQLETDVGPVIDQSAFDKLLQYQQYLQQHAQHVATTPIKPSQTGWFIAPCAYEITSFAELPDEKFGPILHIIRYPAQGLDQLIQQINELGFGLTLGIHSRIENRFLHIARTAHVGNCYINRDQVGATVGSQPFGGRGMSGTGPKAGGPHYLYQFSQALYTIQE
ncbi:bifunctional proline dehydrogenase/L-glutamate gamma-semialdehyde dehydrogenase PutA [Celerinatantimonas sp. YJH-8]|uniref:bifunctional proline dehydrogenase/L-glutamate gamma-semialdehyde dehydrogenase PutA n=1 Tax=Celerinatantimonas sp. YJH-8 TaxID=3228714 RepID=UPI0038C90A8E